MSFITPVSLPLHGAEQLTITSVKFELAKYSFDLYEQFDINVPKQILKSVAKRQAEFLAGRFCAHQALKRLNADVGEVLISENRAPVWPSDVVGSITHCDDLALCCAMPLGSYKRVGIDAEKQISIETIEQVSSVTVTEDERQILKALPIKYNKAFTVAFSAKESLFKALYSEVNRYFEFLDARVAEVNVAQNSFVLVLTTKLTEQLPAGTEICGHFTFIENDTVVTIIADKG